MPIPIPEALRDQEEVGAVKAKSARSPMKYLTTSALAGAYVGVAVVLLVSVAGPLVAAGSPFAKLVGGAVFGVALTLVVFAGAELFTGNAMVMLQSFVARRVTFRDLSAVWGLSLFGNLAGSVLFAFVVHRGATLAMGGGAGGKAVASLAEAKNAATGEQLFLRALLCNLLVCLALWMAARTKSDGAKLAVMWWALLAFVASGFEHSIANMTVFSLAAFAGDATWSDLGRNLAYTIPGNIVGGGLIVGLGYAWVARPAVQAVGQVVLTTAAAGAGAEAAPEVALAGSAK
jgi:nitrite transporter NirC